MRLQIEKHVKASPERTFAAASDFRNAPSFMPAIKKLEVLTEGPIRQGTRFRETRSMFGREATEEMEIVAFDPPRSYALGCNSHGCAFRTEFRFVPNATGTRMEMHFEGQPLTFVAKLMSFLMKPMQKKMLAECAKDLDAIAVHAESRA
jgi:carbon monoxide dehydrogenase subunit G